jgi:hypothetical protein
MKAMTTILGLVFISSTVFAGRPMITEAQQATATLQTEVENNSKIKAVVSALKQQPHCTVLNYQDKQETPDSNAVQFAIGYICDNNHNTDGQQVIDISGRAFVSGGKTEVIISQATAADAPTPTEDVLPVDQ